MVEWHARGVRWHATVAVFVVNDAGEALTFLRRYFPRLRSIPAGHVETGERPIDAARRELAEETGLLVESSDLRLLGVLDLENDECRHGVTHHRWHVFRAAFPPHGTVALNDEGEKLLWLARSTIVGELGQFIPPFGAVASLLE